MKLRAYGVTFDAPGLALPGGRDLPGPADARVRLAGADEVGAAFSGPADPPRLARRRVSDRWVDYETGRDGDALITWEGAGAFHLSAGRDLVTAFAPDGPTPAWTRFLLDSALVSLALRRGGEALHAGTVALAGGAVAVAAGQGGGKTTLVGTLVADGGAVVADDVSFVQRSAAGFAVLPAPPVLNLARTPPPGAPAPEELGDVLAEIDDELWVRAHRAAEEAVELRAVVQLERRAGASLALHRRVPSVVALLRHVLDSGPAAERQRARFATVADLAESTPFYVLEAPLQIDPHEMSHLVRRAVDQA